MNKNKQFVVDELQKRGYDFVAFFGDKPCALSTNNLTRNITKMNEKGFNIAGYNNDVFYKMEDWEYDSTDRKFKAKKNTVTSIPIKCVEEKPKYSYQKVVYPDVEAIEIDLSNWENTFKLGERSVIDTLVVGLDWKDCVDNPNDINLGKFNLSNLDFINVKFNFSGKVTNAKSTFKKCSYLQNISWGGIDLSECKNLDECFSNCKSLEVVDLSSLPRNCSAVDSFYRANKIKAAYSSHGIRIGSTQLFSKMVFHPGEQIVKALYNSSSLSVIISNVNLESFKEAYPGFNVVEEKTEILNYHYVTRVIFCYTNYGLSDNDLSFIYDNFNNEIYEKFSSKSMMQLF